MTEFFQHMINMLILGSTYALLGIGLTLIFGIMRIVNFAHGELYAFGAYFVYFVAVLLGFNFFLSLLIAILAGCILGALIEVVLLRPMRGADIDTTMLIMIGTMIVMQNTEQYVWGGVAKSVSTPFPETPLVIGPFSVSWLRLFVFFAALALIAAAYFLINRTKLGRAMRATFQDRDTAALMGVNIQAIYMATFAIGSSLAAAAGASAALAGPPSAASSWPSPKRWGPDTFPPAIVMRWASCSSSRCCCSSRPGCLRDRSELDEAVSSLDRAARAGVGPDVA
jgi:branched-chain amino acid transport system permease protein